MSLNFNGTVPKEIIYNDTSLSKVIFNGTTVWTSLQDDLVVYQCTHSYQNYEDTFTVNKSDTNYVSNLSSSWSAWCYGSITDTGILSHSFNIDYGDYTSCTIVFGVTIFNSLEGTRNGSATVNGASVINGNKTYTSGAIVATYTLDNTSLTTIPVTVRAWSSSTSGTTGCKLNLFVQSITMHI